MVRKLLFGIVLLLVSGAAQAQFSAEYTEWVKKAMAFYDAKQYQQSADAFSHAFAANGWKGSMDDRYNAACSWAQAGNKDSAFFQLNRIATLANFKELNHLLTDVDLQGLHADSRWNSLCAVVKQNKDKSEENLNKPLVAILDTVIQDDQQYRLLLDDKVKTFGEQSKEVAALWRTITKYDSINVIKVVAIIDKYGWPGPDVVGRSGNSAVFLVIQHADSATQDKYLPVMREAVKNNKAEPSALALLEDRVALKHGKKQIYGSQITGDANGNFLAPLEDPDNVDKRRAEMGLQPLAQYLQGFQMTWNLEEYKKQLPEIEKRQSMVRYQ